MCENFYSYLNGMNHHANVKDEFSVTGSDISEDAKNKDSSEKKEKDESAYRNSEAPKPPIPKWFIDAKKQMKDRIIADVKDQYEEELKQKKESDLVKKQEQQIEAQKALQESVEQNGGNINGLGNGEFLDPNANNPDRVQKEGSMATVDKGMKV